MLEKLCRLLKVKQKLTLDPGADNYFPMDSFSVSRIEVSKLAKTICCGLNSIWFNFYLRVVNGLSKNTGLAI